MTHAPSVSAHSRGQIHKAARLSYNLKFNLVFVCKTETLLMFLLRFVNVLGCFSALNITMGKTEAPYTVAYTIGHM